jgi:hypothetical protein
MCQDFIVNGATRQPVSTESSIMTFINDIQYACRMLRKHPGFTAIALITLAIGIGANTIMFSVVNMLVFRPMQVKDPDRLVYCGMRARGAFLYEDYTDIRIRRLVI